jgi:hypothetical protein
LVSMLNRRVASILDWWASRSPGEPHGELQVWSWSKIAIATPSHIHYNTSLAHPFHWYKANLTL